jgi:hypothetical protein
MAVISVTALTVKPDKYEAFLDLNRKAKTILERCGARNVRLMGTIVAGQASGTLAMTWEADDHASYGAVMDKFWPQCRWRGDPGIRVVGRRSPCMAASWTSRNATPASSAAV